MSGLDVEALLDSTASSKEQTSKPPANGETSQNGSPGGRPSHDRDRARGSSRDRRDRRHRDRSGTRHRNSSSDNGKGTPRSEAGSQASRRRSRSRDSGRHSRRHRGGDGDFYRGGRGGGRSRSRSPQRYYRPRGEERRDHDDRGYRRREDDRGGRRAGRHNTPRDATPPVLTEDERDRRTVFVQQLAARLRTRELKDFFEKVGPVAEAQIVKDRVSNRSKGYAMNPPPLSYLESLANLRQRGLR